MRFVATAALPLLLFAGLLGALSLAPPGVGGARAASFDCAHATTPTEIVICSDPRLSSLDGALGVAYDQRLALDPSVRQIQRAWMKARDIGCGRHADCLEHFMSAQLDWLRSDDSHPSADLPTREGLCSLTAVARIESRLEGAPDSGSAVAESNGAYQVSYDVIPEVQSSRPGDPALVCLVSIPTGCPAGDARGRIYAAANLRTLGAWSAPDAEHSCGGA